MVYFPGVLSQELRIYITPGIGITGEAFPWIFSFGRGARVAGKLAKLPIDESLTREDAGV